jgi:non-ribosomal peptide synthetase component E (peptide arylation enzyme)
MNLAKFGSEQARRYSDRTLTVVDGCTVGYQELVDSAARVAGGLAELGSGAMIESP